MIKSLGLIGVGMIGTSVVSGVKQRQPSVKVYGFDINQHEVQEALAAGCIDHASATLTELVEQSDVIILAVPVGATCSVMTQIRDHIDSDMLCKKIITDVGSVKKQIVDTVQQVFQNKIPFQFIPGHPIAGSEKSGAKAANPNLFVQKRVILTPLQNTHDMALQQVVELWQLLGANIEFMDVEHHDQVLAATSHAPHVLAYAFMHSLIHSPCYEQFSGNSAGGLRDFTRIAGSDPTMWRDISLANRDAILPILDILQQEISDIMQIIQKGDAHALQQYFITAKQARAKIIHNG